MWGDISTPFPWLSLSPRRTRRLNRIVSTFHRIWKERGRIVKGQGKMRKEKGRRIGEREKNGRKGEEWEKGKIIARSGC